MNDSELTLLLAKEHSEVIDNGDDTFTLKGVGQSPTLLEADNLSNALFEACMLLGLKVD